MTEVTADEEGANAENLVQISYTHDKQIQEFSDGLMNQVRNLQEQLKIKDDIIEEMK